MRAVAVIFDLDGTLLDTLGDIAAAMNRALAAVGHPGHDVAAYRAMIGEGARTLAERAAPPLVAVPGAIDALLVRYQAAYADAMVDTTRPYPGMVEVVDALVARGVPLGVLSNKPDAPTRRLVELLFPGRFAQAFGQRDGVPRKPDPRAALELAAILGAPPATTLFVGDTAVDMATAKAAGMVAIGVRWGFRPEELEAAGAARIIDRAEAILALVERYLPAR